MPNYKRKIRKEARREGVRPRLLVAQIGQESGYNPNAVSPAGARGIAQFMPGTAARYGVNLNDNRAGDDIRGAARLMHDLLRRYGGDERKALAAYNAGEGAVDRYGGVPPYKETKAYVRKILAAAGSRGAPGDSSTVAGSGPSYRTIPGVDNSQLRDQLKAAYFQNYHNPQALLELQAGLEGAQDTPSSRVRIRGSQPSEGSQPQPTGGGRVRVDANADRPGVRTKKQVVSFLRRVSSISGHPLRLGTGTNHSRMTVNGNVSQHWTGDAGDVPATGRRLIELGQAALIAAGMPKHEARRQTGGLFNVGGYQVIFNTHEGGDHTNHLHVGI